MRIQLLSAIGIELQANLAFRSAAVVVQPKMHLDLSSSTFSSIDYRGSQADLGSCWYPIPCVGIQELSLETSLSKIQ